MIRLILIALISFSLMFSFSSLGFAQEEKVTSSSNQAEQEEDEDDEESEEDDEDEEDDFDLESSFIKDDKPKLLILPYESNYLEFDLGIETVIFPHSSLFNNYKDSLYNTGYRAAVSYTYDRYRFEVGYLIRELNNSEMELRDKAISSHKSVLSLKQQEYSFFWLKNTPTRISYLGVSHVLVDAHEKLNVKYVDSTTAEFEKDSVGHGFKITVGGRDVGSYYKTSASYTSVYIDSISGKSIHIGGYSLSFHLTFNGP